MSADYSYHNSPTPISNYTQASGKREVASSTTEKRSGSLNMGSTEKSVTPIDIHEQAEKNVAKEWMNRMKVTDEALFFDLISSSVPTAQFERDVNIEMERLRNTDKTTTVAQEVDFAPKVTVENHATTAKIKHRKKSDKTSRDNKVGDAVLDKLNSASKKTRTARSSTTTTTPTPETKATSTGTTSTLAPTRKPKAKSEPSTPTYGKLPLNEIMHIAQEHIPKDMKDGEIRKLGGKFDDVYAVKLGEQHAFVKLGDLLGAGTFNSAYTISDVAGPAIKEFGELVLKMSHKGQSSEEIKQELDTTKLNLPHVVFTVASHTFKVNGEFHVIMLQPALKGGNFEKLSQTDTPIGVKIEALRQFAQAECELQDNSIFHKDIKPPNVMLQQPVGTDSKAADVKVKVIDFGTNIKMDEYDNPKNTLVWRGTPTYAAPEAAAINAYTTPDAYKAQYNLKMDAYKTSLQQYNDLSEAKKREKEKPREPKDLSHTTETLRDLSNNGMQMARKMLLSDDGKIDDAKIPDFHKACEVYSYSVSAFETLFGEMPKMAKAAETIIRTSNSTVAMSTIPTITRDTKLTEKTAETSQEKLELSRSYTEKEKMELFEKAKAKGIPEDFMQLVWQGMDSDPAKRPSMSDFANYNHSADSQPLKKSNS